MSGKRKQEWQDKVLKPALQKLPERQPEFKLPSGIEIQPLYSQEDLQDISLEETPGYPGEYPFGVFGVADFELPVFAASWWNMGQSSVSCVFAESSEAPVDRVTLKKAEARIRNVKVRQPTVFLFISFYPLACYWLKPL